MRKETVAGVVTSALLVVGCAGAPQPAPDAAAEAPAAPVVETAPVESAPPAPEPPKGPEKIDLALAVGPGDVFRFVQKQHIDQAMKVADTDASMTLDAVTTATYTVATVRDDGQADVRVVIGDVKGTFRSSMFGAVEFDTSSGESPKLDNPVIAAVVGGVAGLAHAQFEVTFDRRGGVVAVRGMRELIEKATKGDSSGAGKRLAGLLDDEGMKQQLQGRFVRFSAGPVEVGATWTVDSDIKSPTAMKESTRYVLASADAESVVVSIASTVRRSDALADAPGTTSEGTITVSRRDGMTLKSENKVRTVKDMDLKKPGAPAGAVAPKMHLDMTITATAERVTAGPPAAPAPGAAPK